MLLATSYSLEKFHQYCYGRKVEIQSDHKPLEVIVKKEIGKVPSRLQRMLLKCLRYDYTVTFVPGKFMFIADTLSRAFFQDKVSDDPELEAVVHVVSKHLAVSPEKRLEFQDATKQDQVLQQVLWYHKNGWPMYVKDVSVDSRWYWKFQSEISYSDNLIFMGEKLIVPSSMRRKMLESIHEGHLGIVKCKNRARSLLYWPGMAQQIEDMVSRCEICEKFHNANVKEPMIQKQIPDMAFQIVATDYLEFHGANYLVVVDSYS